MMNKGQSLVEYTVILGVIVAILFAMNPLIKRGIQGMVKTVADQIGNQEAADQDVDSLEDGYLESSQTRTQVTQDIEKIEALGTFERRINTDETRTTTNTVTRLGFTEQN